VWHNRPLGAGMKDDELAAGNPHADRAAVGRKLGQTNVVAVEAESSVGVGDGDLDCSDASLGGDGLNLHVSYLPI
jgi:hypothetical protein